MTLFMAWVDLEGPTSAFSNSTSPKAWKTRFCQFSCYAEGFQAIFNVQTITKARKIIFTDFHVIWILGDFSWSRRAKNHIFKSNEPQSGKNIFLPIFLWVHGFYVNRNPACMYFAKKIHVHIYYDIFNSVGWSWGTNNTFQVRTRPK